MSSLSPKHTPSNNQENQKFKIELKIVFLTWFGSFLEFGDDMAEAAKNTCTLSNKTRQ
jgi:hypothetical protein